MAEIMKYNILRATIIIIVAALAFPACDSKEDGNNSSLFALLGAFKPDGYKCFAYIANSGSDNVTAYTINTRNGQLNYIDTYSTGTGPYAVTTDPAGNFVYVANNNSKTISIFSIDATSGALTETSGSPVDTVYSPGALALNANTFTYAYVANTDASLITPYRADFSTGALTYLSFLNPIGSTNYSWSIACDPSGQFVYVASRDSNSIASYSINLSTGALDAVSGSPFSTDLQPYSIAVDPSGKYLYTATYGSDKVNAYSIASTTGVLTFIDRYNAGRNPRSVTVDTAGKFVYAANMNSNNISAYSIKADTGALAVLSGSPFDIGPDCSTPVSVAVEPSGKFVYVVNNYTENVQAYSINAKSGALTRIGSPVATGHWPFSIVTVKKQVISH